MRDRNTNIMIQFLHDYPSAAAGACAFAVAFGLVAGNAILAQPGKHPDPIWATRDSTTTNAISAEVMTDPEVRPVKTISYRPKSVPVPTPRAIVAAEAPTTVAGSNLVLEIQQELARTGDYRATPDGKFGPFTRSAILAYQQRNGLKADGEASTGLLKVIRLNDDQRLAGRQSAAADPVSGLIKQAGSAGSATGSFNYDSALVQKIQAGLARSGSANIAVDGIFGRATSAAIEEFQRAHDLQVTGRPDEELLRKLQSIGALSNG